MNFDAMRIKANGVPRWAPSVICLDQFKCSLKVLVTFKSGLYFAIEKRPWRRAYLKKRAKLLLFLRSGSLLETEHALIHCLRKLRQKIAFQTLNLHVERTNHLEWKWYNENPKIAELKWKREWIPSDNNLLLHNLASKLWAILNLQLP